MRRASNAYTSRLGVVAQARDDFEHLDRLSRRPRSRRGRMVDLETGKPLLPPVDRIILYINEPRPLHGAPGRQQSFRRSTPPAGVQVVQSVSRRRRPSLAAPLPSGSKSRRSTNIRTTSERMAPSASRGCRGRRRVAGHAYEDYLKSISRSRSPCGRWTRERVLQSGHRGPVEGRGGRPRCGPRGWMSNRAPARSRPSQQDCGGVRDTDRDLPAKPGRDAERTAHLGAPPATEEALACEGGCQEKV